MLHYNPLSSNRTRMDSLWSAQQDILKNDNNFAAFPDPILSLKNLENLDISRNRLQNIPSNIAAYAKLQLLVMTENPWEDDDTILAMAMKMRSNGILVHINSLAKLVE